MSCESFPVGTRGAALPASTAAVCAPPAHHSSRGRPLRGASWRLASAPQATRSPWPCPAPAVVVGKQPQVLETCGRGQAGPRAEGLGPLTPRVVPGQVRSARPGGLLAMQSLGPHPDLLSAFPPCWAGAPCPENRVGRREKGRLRRKLGVMALKKRGWGLGPPFRDSLWESPGDGGEEVPGSGCPSGPARLRRPPKTSFAHFADVCQARSSLIHWEITDYISEPGAIRTGR